MTSRAISNLLHKQDHLKSNIKFIKLVEKHECLWKINSPNYNNKLERTQAWKEIGKAVNNTEIRCVQRWSTYRQAYSLYVRSPDKAKYYLSPHIDFVRPYIRKHTCVHSNKSNNDLNKDDSHDGCTLTPDAGNNLANKSQNQKESSAFQTDTILEQQFLELIEGSGEEKDTNTNSTIAKTSLSDLPDPKATSSSFNNLKRKLEVSCSYSAAETKKANNSKTIIPDIESSVVNKNWMFLESTLSFVDEMSKKQIRRFRRKVMLLLDDVLLNKTHIDKPELMN